MSKTETKSTVLLKHHLKMLKLPTMNAECEKIAARAAQDNVDHLAFLLQPLEHGGPLVRILPRPKIQRGSPDDFFTSIARSAKKRRVDFQDDTVRKSPDHQHGRARMKGLGKMITFFGWR